MRQTEPDVRSYSVRHPAGSVVLPQPPGWDQLVYAASGVLTLEADDARWVVTPRRAAHLPAGTRHRIELTGPARLRSIYLGAGITSTPSGVRAVQVGPLLRELILHVVDEAPLWLDDPRHDRLVRVMLDQLDQQRPVPLRLPWPTDPRARAFAEAVLADPGGDRPLTEVARTTGAGMRTLERLFTAETSLTPQRWRIRARLLHAVRHMADGGSVTGAAVASGYSTPSAFAAAFRQEVGTTPTRFLSGVDDDR